jgi:RNA-binding protein YhbY|tara:strand:- start:858 stop:1124 length:267 start_codon:yes stop_codon:yes gene_type:complete
MMGIPEHIRSLANDRELKVSVRIGREGITENLISEIKNQLGAREVVKIKMNRGLFDREQKPAVWQELAESCVAELVDARGNIATFYRP